MNFSLRTDESNSHQLNHTLLHQYGAAQLVCVGGGPAFLLTAAAHECFLHWCRYRCYNGGRQPTVSRSARSWRVRRAVDADAGAIVECINAAFVIGPGDFDYASEKSEGRTDHTEIKACLADASCRTSTQNNARL